MAYSIWDKQPELVLPQIPFDFLAGLADKQEKQLAAVDDRIGKIKGEFASLVAAPGHEDLSTGLTLDYNNRLNALVDKYKNAPTSREFARELATIGTQFANDQKVQTVVKSRQFYEKFEPKMWEEIAKKSYLDAPGILTATPDGKVSFDQNTQMYDMSKFQLTPQADYLQAIQKQYAIKKEAKYQSSKTTPLYNSEGEIIGYDTKEADRIWNDPENRKETALAIEQMIWDNTSTEPGFTYLRKTAERLHPGDLDAQKQYVRETIRNAGVPFDFNWTNRKESQKYSDDGSGDKDEDKTPAIKGSRSTTTVDPMYSLSGQIINSKEVFESSIVDADSNIAKVEGEITAEFPELAGTGLIATDAGKEIDFTKIKDPQQLSRAKALNMKYVSAQAYANSMKEMQHIFMEKAGLNPDKPLLDQVDANTRGTTYRDGIEFLTKNVGVLRNLAKTQEELFHVTQIEAAASRINVGGDDKSFKEGYEKMLESYQALMKSGNKRLSDSAASFYTPWKTLETSKLREDPKYAKYTEYLNSYLQSPVYREAFNYTPLSEDMGEIRNALRNAKNSRSLERRSIDSNKPALTEDEKNAIISDEDFWNNTNLQLSIRFDESRNDFVVDVDYKGDVIEVPGVVGLDKYVGKIDPKMSNAYLVKQKGFFDGLEETNGRASTVQVYRGLPGAQEEDYKLTVKTALEPIPGVIGANDFMFKIPELNPENVIVAKNHYDIALFMDAYNTYKTAGLSDGEVTQKVNDLLQNPSFQITVIDGNKNGRINQKYFPTWKETLKRINEKK